jgi:hypothetical protein
MRTGDLKPYALPPSSVSEYKGDAKFKRPRDLSLYEPPVITIKKNITIRHSEPGSSRGIKAAYQTEPVSFTSSITAISGQSDDEALQKIATLVLNSSIAHYWLFLTSVGWGVGRPTFRQKEIKSIPFPIDALTDRKHELLEKYDRIKQLAQADDRGEQYRATIQEVDELLFECYDLSETEQGLIQSRVNHTIDYYHTREDSSAVAPATPFEIQAYGETVCREINTFLQHIEADIQPITYEFDAQNAPFKALTLVLQANNPHQSSQDGSAIIEEKLRTLESTTELFDRRSIEIFDSNAIHLIKPNEKRYWSRARAANDAPELVGELIDQA